MLERNSAKVQTHFIVEETVKFQLIRILILCLERLRLRVRETITPQNSFPDLGQIGSI